MDDECTFVMRNFNSALRKHFSSAKPPSWRLKKKKGRVSDPAVIDKMQTEHRCYCMHHHFCLYALISGDIEQEQC